jgi:hypothetical protein
VRWDVVGSEAHAYCHVVMDTEPRTHCVFDVTGEPHTVDRACIIHFSETGHWDMSYHLRLASKGREA